jgi:hypothetical protein
MGHSFVHMKKRTSAVFLSTTGSTKKEGGRGEWRQLTAPLPIPFALSSHHEAIDQTLKKRERERKGKHVCPDR